MNEVIKQNLEFANSCLADKMNASMDAEDLKKLAEGVATTAKAIGEIDDMEQRREAEFDKSVIENDRAEKEEKREFVKTCVEIGKDALDGVIRGVALVGMFIIADTQSHLEAESYVPNPKTFNFIIDGFKNLMRK